jgi:hypothetical protein
VACVSRSMGPEPTWFGGSDWVGSLAPGEIVGVFWLKSASISCALFDRARERERRGSMLEVTNMPGTQAPQSVNIHPDNSVTRHERRPNAVGNPLHCKLGYRTIAAQFGNGPAEATTYLMPREIAGSSKRPDMGLAAGT